MYPFIFILVNFVRVPIVPSPAYRALVLSRALRPRLAMVLVPMQSMLTLNFTFVLAFRGSGQVILSSLARGMVLPHILACCFLEDNRIRPRVTVTAGAWF